MPLDVDMKIVTRQLYTYLKEKMRTAKARTAPNRTVKNQLADISTYMSEIPRGYLQVNDLSKTRSFERGYLPQAEDHFYIWTSSPG